MLSRVADSIFWMARYMERTNGMLRMLRITYVASQNEEHAFSWRSVLQTYGNMPAEKAADKIIDDVWQLKDGVPTPANQPVTKPEGTQAK